MQTGDNFEKDIGYSHNLKSKTFRWYMPIIGEVPMMFYIPKCGEAYEDTKKKIEENGGIVVDRHECFVYQIKPNKVNLKFSDFYEGPVYHSFWIDDAIKLTKDNPIVIGD